MGPQCVSRETESRGYPRASLSRLDWLRGGSLSLRLGQNQPPLCGGWAFALALVQAPLRGYPRAYVRINPLPKISLELVTRMKAWGSAVLRYSRRATAWERDRAVSTTHLGSWV